MIDTPPVSLVDAIKQSLERATDDQHNRLWVCIAEVEAAMESAGDVASLALKFILEREQERLSQSFLAQRKANAVLQAALDQREKDLKKAKKNSKK